MTDNHDVDGWLRERIEPLPPPPGTFDAIRRRARRRKFRKLAVSAGAAVVVVAAAVTVPQVVNLPMEKGRPAAEGSSATTASVGPASPTGQQNVEAPTSTPIVLPRGNPVPPNFQPASVTFVSDAIGFVIGQAGTPGHCATQWCTSVARTQDDGRTWTGLPAPLTGAPDGAAGVGQIRFLEGLNGWAFGPELWSTHDGGEHWAKIGTHGRRVIDVETVGKRAFAVEAACTGTGTTFAAHCTSFTLYSTLAGKNAWTPVGSSTSGLTGGKSAALVLTGAQGYLLGPDGQLYSGPVDGSAGWTGQGNIPCDPGAAQPDGQPSRALLAAATADKLFLYCAAAGQVFASPDGGSSWQQSSAAPAGITGTSLAASPAATLVLSTTTGIEIKPAAEDTWRAAAVSGGTPAAGFSFAGMTTNSRGVALPVRFSEGAVWFTRDGGLSWTASQVQGTG